MAQNLGLWTLVIMVKLSFLQPGVLAHLGTENIDQSIELTNNSGKINPRLLPLFRQLNGDENEYLENWVAPYELRKAYPYYLAGHDYEDRPVWIVECGRWNYRKIIEGGPSSIALFDKYLNQTAYRMAKSYQRAEGEDGASGVTFICDMADFDIVQLAHVPTITYLLRTVGRLRNWFEDHLELCLLPNTNAVAQSLVNLARPVLGGFFSKIQVFGTQKSKWKPQVLKYIPHDQLPSWYGGNSKWVPLQVYG